MEKQIDIFLETNPDATGLGCTQSLSVSFTANEKKHYQKVRSDLLSKNLEIVDPYFTNEPLMTSASILNPTSNPTGTVLFNPLFERSDVCTRKLPSQPS